MPNKQLTAKVRLNTKDAEKSIDRLVKKINQINNTVNKVGSNNKVEKQLNNSNNKLTTIQSKVKAWAKGQSQVTANLRSTNGLLGTVGSKLQRLAATYLGIMGLRGAVNTSDIITHAENRLNQLNGGDSEATQESLDKMYVSANKARMAYTDMIANASKSMTLAPDAFQGNIDNAIRFQEIMAETYTLGGASAEEMSSSMYQMIQALGAGTLAGDELRSVREGAPLAYKAIEEFAQGIYNTEESLKDLASQGKITSDMVVAAIMDAGTRIDKQFENTSMTFDQAWNRIKSSAVKAFEPVSKALNDMLNKAAESGAFEKIEQAFWNMSKALQIIFKKIEDGVAWIADNWDWFKYVVIFVLLLIIFYLAYLGYQFVATALKAIGAWLVVNSSMLLTIVAIALVVLALVWLANQCQNFCDFIFQLCMILVQVIIGVLIVVLAAYLATGTVMLSIPTLIALCIIGVILLVVAAFVKYTGEIVGTAYGLYYSIEAICTNIGIGWQNMCSSLKSWFYNAIADMLENCEWLLNGVNKIREALGKDPIDIGGIRAKADSAAEKGGQSYVSVGDAWSKGYEIGNAKGQAIQDKINGWGDKIKNFNLGSGLDGIGKKLGLDFGDGILTGDPSDLGVGGSYNTPDDLLSGIKDDTGKMADSMDLTQEDLEYLRKIAEMEWKKEFTTASITVDMSNYNTVSGDSDLDGIVTKLSDKLREELSIVANGVYA